MTKTFLYQDGRLLAGSREPVQEFPLKLIVNGREIATLIASPHDLRELAAGFLYLQGFVESRDDFHVLSVCAEFGVAQIRIRGDLPEKLRPILTSGCGTGVTFSLPERTTPVVPALSVDPQAVLRLQENLARRAEAYRKNGGMHSAAIGDADGNILFFAEDIGRHNTIDRIAGTALLEGVSLSGRMLATSGRISTELAAKAARLGLILVASRSAATDMAVKVCSEAGIILVGYVRGGRMTIYSGAEKLQTLPVRIPGVTGVILAGGESRRMGCDKSLLPLRGSLFIDHVYRTMANLFDEVLIVTNSPELYGHIPCRKVPDIYPVRGSLTGIHSGLCHAGNARIFVAGCDMPFVDADLIRTICRADSEAGVVIPLSASGPEPLHALYGKSALAAIEKALDLGRKRIVSFFDDVSVHQIPTETITAIDPDGRSFCNINTPQEYYALQQDQRSRDSAAALAGSAG